MKTSAHVLYLRLEQEGVFGHGEAVPYARYGESADSVRAQLENVRGAVEEGVSLKDLQSLLPPGAARNALDLALWDLEARLQNKSVWELTGYYPDTVATAQTIVIGSVEEMAQKALELCHYPLLKVKLDQHQIVERMTAIRANAPAPQIVVDANESWTFELLKGVAHKLASLDIALLEQPLHADEDEVLRDYVSPIPLCADESCHSSADIQSLRDRYRAVNIKLDKTGGLSEAMRTYDAARALDMTVMLGCMVGTSLAMTPMLGLASTADFVDLDGPTWLKRDRDNGLIFKDGKVTPPQRGIWGGV